MNSALTYFCQFGESSDIKLRNIAALLHQMIREPCFTQLRTKEQLGYVRTSSEEARLPRILTHASLSTCANRGNQSAYPEKRMQATDSWLQHPADMS